jgi:outer membrane protein OmpA-like peptidoglycan-associated protein
MEQKIALLKEYPHLRIRIYGHTCNKGSVAVNERIGLARANDVRSNLIANGISPDRILSVASIRDSEPVVPNVSDESHLQNRRVQIIVER